MSSENTMQFSQNGVMTKTEDEIFGEDGGTNGGEQSEQAVQTANQSNKSEKKTKQSKTVTSMMKKAGVDSIPSLDHLMRGKPGTRVKISDIGIFISEPTNEELKHLYERTSCLNRINCYAYIAYNRVKEIGAELIHDGRMYQPISVAQLEDGRLECTSGRHRLTALAFLYGVDTEVPVHIEEMSMTEAKNAVVVSNQARQTNVREKINHTAVQSVGGGEEVSDVSQDKLYNSTAVNKTKAVNYAIYSILERGHPKEFCFNLTQDRRTKSEGVTTVASVKSYLQGACNWDKDMSREAFDREVADAVKFINNLFKIMQKHDDFNPRVHMSTKLLNATGQYYKTLVDANADIDEDVVNRIALSIIPVKVVRSKTELFNTIKESMKS